MMPDDTGMPPMAMEDMSKLEEGFIFRILPRVRAEVFLNVCAEALGAQSVVLTVDNKFVWRPFDGDGETHNFLVASLNFFLNENVSLGLTFQNGESAPLYEDIQTLGVTLGIRF